MLGEPHRELISQKLTLFFFPQTGSVHSFMESHLGRREEMTMSGWALGEGEVESRLLCSIMSPWSRGVNIEGEWFVWMC